MMFDAARAQAMEGVGPEDQEPTTALDMILEEDAEVVIDILRGMLAKHGMTGEQIDTALEAECSRWLADQTEQWWER
jgi:hypothetical protein